MARCITEREKLYPELGLEPGPLASLANEIEREKFYPRPRIEPGPLALRASALPLRHPGVHRCGPGDSMRACHSTGPGSIPGRDKFPG